MHLADDVILVEEFKKYLINEGYAEDRVNEHAVWAFFIENHESNWEFVECLRNIAGFKKAEKLIMKTVKKGGVYGKGIKNPKGYVSTYLTSISLFKEFVDRRYGGIVNYLKKEQST